METIKIQVHETVSREVEITLPVFKKSICHFFKVYNDKECICVTDTSFNPSIAVNNATIAFMSDHVECTESEFLEAYNKVSIRLEELALGM